MFESGDLVRHERFGLGRVRHDDGTTVLVRFEEAVQECRPEEVQAVLTPEQALGRGVWHPPLPSLNRIQAELIRTINAAWGVFTRCRIDLLPHQLWVCHKVTRNLPARWLVADDVGLGKTVEAGLILLPLLSRGLVKRLLVLCPASLVSQWVFRMRTMFDVRLTPYIAEADNPRLGFWQNQDQVIVSLQTLRLDRHGRHGRLLDAEPWDLVIVDEAHHLNADEEQGPTLGYRLLESLQEAGRVRSMVFFTGTPHRGKTFGFLALMRLLRGDLFDPRRDLTEQLPHLREVMIRNNKQNVTDLRGNRIFKAPRVTACTYGYSPAEARFYDTLTEFILTGKAYASALSNATEGRAVMLVLVAMQKIASSSVAAIRRALRKRLERVGAGRQRVRELEDKLGEYAELDEASESDRASALEEELVSLSAALRLMEDEEPRLRELVAAAESVTAETKISTILGLLDGPFAGRAVLFFTEYKATQSLLMSALIARHGPVCVTFINGDDCAEEVLHPGAQVRTLRERRERAAERFTSGEVRYLVSTEAGGEGIDLQACCHSLVHVDLPWNPMRLHQRVGRLNRYGQAEQVEVFTVRNPETVESRIWDKLNAKIDNIMLALREVMDEPEDLLQLVLGMASPGMFRDVFAGAASVPPDSLASWFDQRTARFGGRDVLETVSQLVGHCARFDFAQVADQIPPLDLPDLRPFFVTALELNHRRAQEDGNALSFKTPESWRTEPAVRAEYRGMVFDRKAGGKDTSDQVLGVGHAALDNALAQAAARDVCVTLLPDALLPRPLWLFRIADRVTTTASTVHSVLAGLEGEPSVSAQLVRDWQLVRRLNEVALARSLRRDVTAPAVDRGELVDRARRATQLMSARLDELGVRFAVPEVGLFAVLWPAPTL
jgi:superfamily II DNA or RNA helicase